jgi:hypothetical protein
METKDFRKYSREYYIWCDTVKSYKTLQRNRADSIREIPLQIISLIMQTALCLIALLGLSIIAFDLAPKPPNDNQFDPSPSGPF